MRFLNLTIGLFVLLSLATISAEPAHACSCILPVSPTEEFQRAGAVFSGTVTSVSQPLRSTGQKKVTFDVEQSWKDISSPTVTIETGIGGGDCGFDFEKGKTYLVYTEGPDPRRANICSRTKELAAAAEDLGELGAPVSSFTDTAKTTTPISPRVLAGLGTIVIIVAGLFWLTKRLDQKRPLV